MEIKNQLITKELISKSYSYKDNQIISYTVSEPGYKNIGENTYRVKKSNPDVSGIEKLGKKEGLWIYKLNNGLRSFINYKNGEASGLAVSLDNPRNDRHAERLISPAISPIWVPTEGAGSIMGPKIWIKTRTKATAPQITPQKPHL